MTNDQPTPATVSPPSVCILARSLARRGAGIAAVCVAAVTVGVSGMMHPVPLHAQTVDRAVKAVDVTGEFRDDGTCQVFADGVPVFRTEDSAQTSYIRGALLNTAPSGFETHEVWCAPRGPDQPMPPLDYTERLFVIMLYAPTDHLAAARTYQIMTGAATPLTASFRASAALFGVTPQVVDDSRPLRVGLIYLTGTRGEFTVTKVDSAVVAGRFTMRGQKALSM